MATNPNSSNQATAEDVAREMLNMPIDTFSPRYNVNYVGITGLSGNSDGTMTITSTTTTGSTVTTTTLPGTTTAGDTATTVVSNPYWITTYPQPFGTGTVTIGPDMVPLVQDAIPEDELRALMQRAMSRRPPTTDKSLSEMIRSIRIEADRKVVIEVVGPKINGSGSVNVEDPEFVKRLDREIKAAIIRAFDLVLDVKKLENVKRTLIID